ncbi:ArsR/SmtB family transcription factor [Kitasatospora kifunensis]|uniref:DNA-binding transcriptional ArsR family regulator n=1 Tax=Kitasatospora kifunensis TaxID=58351 RepID=A0A7W7VT68_KITKI|nr:helix-turn-helix domain-containing protein [Kitasatospora kifunensis]MBB4921463.1 DNA-binding transcriptional ArsR family regulator [Kitasatospora kifunensis]
MIEYRLGIGDLATIWFAFSPLQETVLSLRLRHTPGNYPEQRGWAASWQSRYEGLDCELLDALMAPRGFCPDFLTPRPLRPRPGFEGELALLAATPPQRVVGDIVKTYACDGSPVPAVLSRLMDDPAALLERISAALAQYFTCCLAPAWWPRARSVLEADLAYRGRTLAEGGVQALFTGLDARVSWADGFLRVTDNSSGTRELGRTEEVEGRGMVLIPTLFALGALTDISPGGRPLISYPARGKATMAENVGTSRRTPVPAALSELIGTPRARLLGLLEQPATTTMLAHLLGVTPGAVSRHLSALTAAGLLVRTRDGRSVFYHRSQLGDSLYMRSEGHGGGAVAPF